MKRFVLIVVVVLLSACSGGATDFEASIPEDIDCDVDFAVVGGWGYASGTDRVFAWTWDWAKARQDLVQAVRKEAEKAAQESLDDQIDDVECPEECPDLNAQGQATFNTSSSLSGSNGYAWIRYDAQAESQATQTFQCN